MLTIEYRITTAEGDVFYLTVHIRKRNGLDGSRAHTEAINDGLVHAALEAQRASWWTPGMEFNKVEFWQVH